MRKENCGVNTFAKVPLKKYKTNYNSKNVLSFKPANYLIKIKIKNKVI